VLASTSYIPSHDASAPRSYTVQGVSYQLVKEIGKGGSSVVYCAMRGTDQELVALKLVVGKDNVDQLRDEIQLLLRLRNLPNVVQYMAHDVQGLQVWF
jgi:serine/threonine protein kinase